ncbi:MAG: hypothetical protein EAZ35_04085 [Sphingobacteriia bacterium]|nr:MAG: hypothetical protein EAZ35_04085 [Sphingobacteriia bacterium]
MMIMKKKVLAVVLLLISFSGFSQLKVGKDNIAKLCGCFEIDFKYVETFSPDTAYPFHKREHSRGTELVLPVANSNNKIVLQHLLIVNDSFIVKHWREDWEYQATDWLVYQGNKQWIKQPISASDSKAKWTQTVWEVDDAPRYQGTSAWINTKEKTYWENTTNAPLPRREYTTRNDYQILKRGNHIAVSDKGWIHEQDNDKIAMVNGKEKIIAQEKGMNAYTKTTDNNCLAAKIWWEKNGAFWNNIRIRWEEVIKAKPTIILKSKFENKRLDEYFTNIFNQWTSKSISLEEAGIKAKTIIEKFVSTNENTALK